MMAVKVVSGRAVPLDRSDVDTDQIIPAQWLKRVERSGFGAGLFGAWRDDREFVLNKVEYAGASILVAGPNFGVGSSREHAVWALMDYGFKVVISPRFGDIFRNNSPRSGLVPAQVSSDFGRTLLETVTQDPSAELTVDVERLTIEIPAKGIEGPFSLEPAAQHRLLEGLDDISVTLKSAQSIARYEAERASWLPSTA